MREEIRHKIDIETTTDMFLDNVLSPKDSQKAGKS